ncbi:hypothetical protein TNCV_2554641 [Trichonephila clavipes]|nr:hypothetical protein TNCV_2554641 [Trichonephila clavipes]
MREWVSANEKNKEWHKHMLRAQQSTMQPNLRMHICEPIIRILQHQICSVLNKRNTIGCKYLKDVNQKQRICVKHGFGVSNHTIIVALHSSTTQWKILG